MRRFLTVSVLVAALVVATGTGAAIAGHRKAHRNSQAASSSERAKVTAGNSKKNRSTASVGTNGGSQNGGWVGAKGKAKNRWILDVGFPQRQHGQSPGQGSLVEEQSEEQ